MKKKHVENEIEFSELLKFLLSKWKGILIGIIIITVLVTGVMVGWSVLKSDGSTSEEAASEEKNDYEKVGLTSEEGEQLEAAVSLKAALNNYYSYFSDMVDGSEVYVIQYALKLINNPDGVKDTILFSIEEYINNGGLAEEIINSGFNGMSKNSVKNAISMNYVSSDNGSSNTVVVEENESGQVLAPFSMICKGESKEINAELAEYVRTGVSEIVDEYAQAYNIELQELGSFEGVGDEYSVIQKVNSLNSGLVNLEKQYTTFYDEFSDDQIEILNVMLENKVYTVSELLEKGLIQEKTAAAEKTVTSKLLPTAKKGIAAGVLVGIILMALFYIFKYTRRDFFLKDKEVSELYGMFCLGNIGNAKKLSTAKSNFTAANIRAISSKNEYNRVCLVTADAMEESGEDEIAKIAAELKESGIELVNVGNILENVEAFEALLQFDAMVLLVKLGETKFGAMDKVADIVEEHHINVIGAVVE